MFERRLHPKYGEFVRMDELINKLLDSAAIDLELARAELPFGIFNFYKRRKLAKYKVELASYLQRSQRFGNEVEERVSGGNT